MKISELSNHLIYPSKYLKSNHLNKNTNMKFKQLLIIINRWLIAGMNHQF